MDKRIAVTSSELARAIRVWLRVMPKPIWRALEKYQLAALEKRQDPDEEPQVHGAVADHLAEHLRRANWEITRPEPKNLGSPPAWRGGIDWETNEDESIRGPSGPWKQTPQPPP